MEQTVYLDLLFLINFSMDFLCFYLSSKILSVPMSTGRAVAASVIGGVYADAALFLPFGNLICLACDLCACAVMCAAAYAKRGGWRDVPFYTIVYFAVSMALGGAMTAIFNLLNNAGVADMLSPEGSGDGISAWLFALIAAISAVITLLGGRFFKRRSSIRTAQIEVSYEGVTKKLDAFVDSGNLLRDPISGKPCIVVNAASLSDVFPKELLKLSDSSRLKISSLADVSATNAKRVRLIPSRTAGSESILLGVSADAVRIITQDRPNAYDVDAMIVISSFGKAAEGKDALLPAELLL